MRAKASAILTGLTREHVLFAGLVLFALYFSLADFLVRPALWFDEGITIEIARNFSLYGHLDVLSAPHVFSGLPYLVGTNGYPLTIPLALVFKVFGLGLLQARIFMLFWLCATLIALYGVTKKLFGPPAALSATALTVTFASFYGNGLTATGEMPALFFFILGIWFLIGRKDYFWTGIFWGLAMASKPGVFLLLAHTTVLYVLLFDRERWFKKIFTAGLGFLPPVLLWIGLAFPLTLETFYSVIAYLLNPIDIPFITEFLRGLPVHTYEGIVVSNATTATENVSANLRLLVTSSTLIYFTLLSALVVAGLYLGRAASAFRREALGLLFVYGSLVVFFFVRGPGWFRYLFGVEVLIFVLLYPALQELFSLIRGRLAKTWASGYVREWNLFAVIIVLGLFQLFQLYFLSDVPRSTKPLEAIAYVQELMTADTHATVGIYDAPALAAFTDPERTYHISQPHIGYLPLGESPLLLPSPPDIIVVTTARLLVGEKEEAVLRTSYTLLADTGVRNYDIYMKAVSEGDE